jgi:hypothetical protein
MQILFGGKGHAVRSASRRSGDHMNLQAHSGSSVPHNGAVWHARFAEAVRLIVAPLLLFAGGFFTADFLLSGVYTWPQTSHVVALTITILVLSYEFVYKEQKERFPHRSHDDRLKILLYSCVIPYTVGAVALIALARLAS